MIKCVFEKYDVGCKCSVCGRISRLTDCSQLQARCKINPPLQLPDDKPPEPPTEEQLKAMSINTTKTPCKPCQKRAEEIQKQIRAKLNG